MRVTILGSGTSFGVPVIGCDCPVCCSEHPRNRHLRSSAVVEVAGKVLLIDTAPDLREQAMRFHLERVDAVLYTHAHADHIHGIDELRIFNVRHLHSIPCYANAEACRKLKGYFAYIFDEEGESSMLGKPHLTLHEVTGPFAPLGIPVVPIPMMHGQREVFGYRIGGFAYLTDVSRLPESSLALLQGLEWMVIDALRARPHPTHFSIDQALEVIAAMRPARAALTDLSHQIDYETINSSLPPGVELAYDGMVFELLDPDK